MSLFKNNIIEVLDATQKERDILNTHPIYSSIKTISDLKIFMENHIFAVWDFMSILKSLQIELTCVKTPWIPKKNSHAARLINEIVVDEETDSDPTGGYGSHFELYLLSMAEAGANIEPINSFISGLSNGEPLSKQLKNQSIPSPAKEFVRSTFSEIENAPVHILAAAFTFGREEVIPQMFKSFIKKMNMKNEKKLDTFIYYLDRHVKLDGDVHGSMALNMVKQLCGDDRKKWQESIETSKRMLTARAHFWNGIQKTMSSKNHTQSIDQLIESF